MKKKKRRRPSPPSKRHATAGPGPPDTTAQDIAAKLRTALSLHQQGQLEQAQAAYEDILLSQPRHADTLLLLGIIAYQSNDLLRAVQLLDKAIEVNPGNAAAYNNRGNALSGLQRLEEALASYGRAIELNADYSEAYSNRGNVLLNLKRPEEALVSYERAIQLQPDNAEAYYNSGIALLELKHPDKALICLEEAIRLQPAYVEAHNNRGNALLELKRPDEALVCFEQAIRLLPDYAEAYYNHGNVLLELKRPDEALASYDSAVQFKPDYAKAYYNRGNALDDLKRPDEALASYDRAIQLKPDYAEAYNNRGNVLLDLKNRAAALASYENAIQIKPDYAEAHNNRGNVLVKLGRYAEAVKSYTQLLELDPEYPFAKGNLIHAKMLCCDWEGTNELYLLIEEDIRNGKRSAHPFGHQGLSHSEQELQHCAEIYAAEVYPSRSPPLCRNKMRRHAKIRLGYLSGEFRQHATSILMAELWELHAKSHFEIFAFDNGSGDGSPLRARIEKAFNEVVDITRLSDLEAAELIHGKEIDILVNLNGYFGEGRQGIFSYRPSPIQVNYLGFPGTIGAPYIDYLIADATVIPEANKEYYFEKIVYLPNCYQANDSKRVMADRLFSRAELELPQTGFVFCCFNNNYKITPATFDGWMRILKAVEGSVLWLLADDPASTANLSQEAEARGITADRLIFAKRMPLPEHLARQRAADLFLDTLPYNAHTTASDALWAGVPLLTRMGQTFAGRVAASLLSALRIPELVTTTQKEYEALAIELATQPERLRQIRQMLEKNRLTTPLFDSNLFTAHIEKAYLQMYERYQADLPPEHIHVQGGRA